MSDLVGNPEDRFSRVAALIEWLTHFATPKYKLAVNPEGQISCNEAYLQTL